ncbi:MAG: GIY-YIG nuclease family protein [Gammaproteobacteria bacterium]|nr:GIY-YIG nuclease family protein [Gammaproteobacteria bacterium]
MASAPEKSEWYVYIVRCNDDTLYTGVAKDVERRLNEHNQCNTRGAKYTRARRPVVIAYYEAAESRSAAGKREYAIRRLSREQKEALILEFLGQG